MAKYLVWLTLGALSLVGVFVGLIGIALLQLPKIENLRGCLTARMYNVELCPGKGRYASLDHISSHVINAVLISEDASFFSHSGFDFDEIKESIDRNIERGTYARGGSTISQQLVKNVFLSSEKSLLRKAKEAFLTYELEKHFKKKEILERYLNVVAFGDKLYGIGPAASFYFQKSPQELNVLEAAFLAALLPNPIGYAQSFKKKSLTPFMRSRVITICRKLYLTGKLSQAQFGFVQTNVDAFPWAGLVAPSETEFPPAPNVESESALVPSPEEAPLPDSAEVTTMESSTSTEQDFTSNESPEKETQELEASDENSDLNEKAE